MVEKTPRSVPAPGHSTPMPFTAAISRTFARPSLLSMIVQLISSPSGLSGQTSARCLYSASDRPQNAGADAHVVGPRAALRLEAHRGNGLPHLFGALGLRQHQAAHAEIQLPGDVGVNRRLVELRRLDDERMRETQRRLGQRARVLHARDERRERRQRALEAAFHAAVEDEVAVLVARRLPCASSAGVLSGAGGVAELRGGAAGRARAARPPRRLLGA